jgi:hypothetical protein
VREVDERERNLRFAEVDLFARILMLIGNALTDKGKVNLVQDWLREYGAELYQDCYVPEWALEKRVLLRRKQDERRREASSKAALLAKVNRMSG